MKTLYRCPSVRSNRVVTETFSTTYTFYMGHWWYLTEVAAIEANRMKRNKLIARKAREIQKLSEVY